MLKRSPLKWKSFRLEFSGQNLSNSLCQFWNYKSIPLQILYPSSFSWKVTSCSFFSQTIYIFLKRSPLNWTFLRLSIVQVKICQIPYANFVMTNPFLSKFCIPLHFHERLLICTFLAKTIYTLLKRSPLKWKFLRLLSAQVKICQISYVSFVTTSRFLSKFCILLQFHER